MTCKDCHWWHDGCALAFDWDEQPTADSEPCREFDRRAILNAVSIALDDGIRVVPDDGK